MRIPAAHVDVGVPRDHLFAYITDTATVKQWQPDVIESRALTDGGFQPGARWRVTVNEPRRGRFDLETWVIAVTPNERVVYGMDEPSASAEIEYRLADIPTGTRVESEANFRLKGIMKILTPLVRGMVKHKFESRLKLLRDAAEADFVAH